MEINNNFFEDNELTNYINNNLNDPYKETNFKNYIKIGAIQKGTFGEMYIDKYCRYKGLTVNDRNNVGHDRIINNIKTEIKFTLSNIINHISFGKDWDRLLICCIDPIRNTEIIKWIDKKSFIQNLIDGLHNENKKYFNHQQGGKKCNNDDYMCSGKKLNKLLDSDLVNSINEW